jgi:predicted Zn-dependent protease
LSWASNFEGFKIKIEEDPKMFKPYVLFDDDGLPTRKKVIVSSTLNPLFDVYFACKYGKDPTGNGFYLHLEAPNGIGYTYLSFEAEEKRKLEEFDRAIWGLYFNGWHTCLWSEGKINVKLDHGILYENGTPAGIVSAASLDLDLKEYTKKAVSIDHEVSQYGIKFKPFVVMDL